MQRGKPQLGAPCIPQIPNSGHVPVPTPHAGVCSQKPQTSDAGIFGDTFSSHHPPPPKFTPPPKLDSGHNPCASPGFRTQSLCFSPGLESGHNPCAAPQAGIQGTTPALLLQPGSRAQPLHPPSLSQRLQRGLDSGHHPRASFQAGIQGTTPHPPRLSQSLPRGHSPGIASHHHSPIQGNPSLQRRLKRSFQPRCPAGWRFRKGNCGGVLPQRAKLTSAK